MDKKIAIIGGGNIGTAIAKGILKSSIISPENLTITKRRVEKLDKFKDQGVKTTSNNMEAVEDANYIILAVQPAQIFPILQQIGPYLDPEKSILISTAASITIDKIREIIPKSFPLFRAMPNTAIEILESITCISTDCKNSSIISEVKDIFSKLGKAVIIDEDLFPSATVLGACGIAFSLRFLRAASQAGIEIGFDSDIAQLIASQTMKGAVSLLFENMKHPEYEIDKVTTPRGATISGLNEMEHKGFSSALIKGITKSYNKIIDIQKD